MWTYLSEPYSLTLPGVYTEEFGEWSQDGQILRRLAVRYPTNIATHSAEQMWYVDARDEDGDPARDMVLVTIDIDDVTVS